MKKSSEEKQVISSGKELTAMKRRIFPGMHSAEVAYHQRMIDNCLREHNNARRKAKMPMINIDGEILPGFERSERKDFRRERDDS